MFLHSIFQVSLGATDVVLACQITCGFVDYHFLAAFLSIDTFVAAVALKVLACIWGEALDEFDIQIALEEFMEISESVVAHGNAEPF